MTPSSEPHYSDCSSCRLISVFLSAPLVLTIYAAAVGCVCNGICRSQIPDVTNVLVVLTCATCARHWCYAQVYLTALALSASAIAFRAAQNCFSWVWLPVQCTTICLVALTNRIQQSSMMRFNELCITIRQTFSAAAYAGIVEGYVSASLPFTSLPSFSIPCPFHCLPLSLSP